MQAEDYTPSIGRVTMSAEALEKALAVMAVILQPISRASGLLIEGDFTVTVERRGNRVRFTYDTPHECE